MAVNEIVLKLSVDGREANATLKLTDNELNKLAVSMRKAGEASREVGSKIVHSFAEARNLIQGFKETVSVISGVFNSSLSSYQNQEKANIQLATAMKQAGAFTNEAYQSLLNYSAELQNFTIFGDDATTTVMAQLYAMGLNTEQIKAATLQTANLASLMGTDLSTAARAMADLFKGNLGMIGRYIKGIDETVIKSGDLNAIIQELNKHIGGQAEALGNTALGSMAKFNNAVDDFRENVGGALTTALMPFVDHIKDLITNLNKTSPALTGIIGAVGALGAATATLSITGIMPMIINFNTLTNGLKYGAGIFKIAAAEGMIFRGTLWGIGTAVKGLMASIGPAGWLILGITLLTEAVNLLSSANDGLTDSEKEIINNADAEKIKFEQLTKAVLDQNKSLDERNRAKQEAQKLYPGFLENLSIEKTNHNDLVAAIAKETEGYYKLIKIKILNKQLELAIEELAKKKNEEVTPNFFDGILAAAQSLFNGTQAVVIAQTNAAVRHAQEIAAGEKKIEDIVKESYELTKDDGSNNKKLTEEELKKLFDKNKTELSESQRHQASMLQITSGNDLLMLKLKINHFNQMIDLYRKFNQDTTNLINQRAEAETQLSKKTTKLVIPPEYDANLKKKYEMNQRTSEEMLGLEKNHQKESVRISGLETKEKLQLLNEQKDYVAFAFGEISNVFAKHTLAYQAFAKAQALIDTYTAAEAAYKAVIGIPFVGPALAIAAAAAAIAAGLARVEQIGKVNIPQGYATGGRLPQGKAGYVEGWHNEIIAPEKTFVEVFRQELRPQIYGNNAAVNYDLSGIKESINKLNTVLEQGIKANAYLDDREAKKIRSRGNYLNGRSKL